MWWIVCFWPVQGKEKSKSVEVGLNIAYQKKLAWTLVIVIKKTRERERIILEKNPKSIKNSGGFMVWVVLLLTFTWITADGLLWLHVVCTAEGHERERERGVSMYHAYGSVDWEIRFGAFLFLHIFYSLIESEMLMEVIGEVHSLSLYLAPRRLPTTREKNHFWVIGTLCVFLCVGIQYPSGLVKGSERKCTCPLFFFPSLIPLIKPIH